MAAWVVLPSAAAWADDPDFLTFGAGWFEPEFTNLGLPFPKLLFGLQPLPILEFCLSELGNLSLPELPLGSQIPPSLIQLLPARSEVMKVHFGKSSTVIQRFRFPLSFEQFGLERVRLHPDSAKIVPNRFQAVSELGFRPRGGVPI